MDHVITIGNVFEVGAAVIAVSIVIGGIVWLLSALAQGFDH